MRITDFQELNNGKKSNTKEKLAKLKLEDIQSSWYFIVAKQKVVLGSKG